MARPYSVLFLCTGNSARSVMAESILRAAGAGRFNAFSAGSTPKRAVHPMAIDLLAAHGLPTLGLASKGWEVFAGPDAPAMDFVITVCNSAAGEVCPVWPGQPITAHWSVPDPAAVAGTDEERRDAFAAACRMLSTRIRLLVDLPLAELDQHAIKRALDEIGRAAA